MCSPALHNLLFHTPVARYIYSLYVLKVPLNTKQANKQTITNVVVNGAVMKLQRMSVKSLKLNSNKRLPRLIDLVEREMEQRDRGRAVVDSKWFVKWNIVWPYFNK